jgi:hypothetical protein
VFDKAGAGLKKSFYPWESFRHGRRGCKGRSVRRPCRGEGWGYSLSLRKEKPNVIL